MFPYYILTSCSCIFYMWCCSKSLSISTVFLGITLLVISPDLISVQDCHSYVSLSPYQISANILNPHAALENPWPLFSEKKKSLLERWDISQHHAIWSSEPSWLLEAEACFGNPTTCINVQPSLSPANVSLQPKRRYNFAAYMGLRTTSLLS